MRRLSAHLQVDREGRVVDGATTEVKLGDGSTIARAARRALDAVLVEPHERIGRRLRTSVTRREARRRRVALGLAATHERALARDRSSGASGTNQATSPHSTKLCARVILSLPPRTRRPFRWARY